MSETLEKEVRALADEVRALSELVRALHARLDAPAQQPPVLPYGKAHPRNEEALALLDSPSRGAAWARRLGVGKATVYRWISERNVPPFRVEQILQVVDAGEDVVARAPRNGAASA